jgi:hypothetical protein
MTTSPAHIKAQKRIADILCKHYKHIGTEIYTPTPNEKYIYDGEEFVIKPYSLDVQGTDPLPGCICEHKYICVEVDGKKGHKTSKRQTIRDKKRTKQIEDENDEFYITRIDTKDLVGRGYVNPKTKKRHSILTDAEILTELGVKCQHA